MNHTKYMYMIFDANMVGTWKIHLVIGISTFAGTEASVLSPLNL